MCYVVLKREASQASGKFNAIHIYPIQRVFASYYYYYYYYYSLLFSHLFYPLLFYTLVSSGLLFCHLFCNFVDGSVSSYVPTRSSMQST